MTHQPLSILELTELFPTEKDAEDFMVQERWPDEVCCCKCGSTNVQARPNRKPQPFRCRDCRRDFSVKTDTLMHSSPLSCRKWLFAIYLVGTSPKGLSSRQLARIVGVSTMTAWHMLHRIRENFDDRWPAFEGTVEVDETHIGGKFRAMHAKKRRERRKEKNYGKTIVVGARERETGRVVAAVVPDTTIESLLGFVARRVSINAQLYTDEAPSYAQWPRQKAVKHKQGEYVRGDVSTNGIESVGLAQATLARHTPLVVEETHDPLRPGVLRPTEHARALHLGDDGRNRQGDGLQATSLPGTGGRRARGSRARGVLVILNLTADNGLPSGARG